MIFKVISFKLILLLFIIKFDRVKAQTCKIELIDIKTKTKVCNPLNLIRGKITCNKLKPPYSNNLSRNITAKGLDFQQSWPINSLNEFKAIVKLKKGINKISFTYVYKNENAKLVLELNYEENLDLDPLRLGIFASKDSSFTFDMDKESKSLGDKNNLDSAIKRIQTAGLLAQALTSDNLNHHGYGRKTFRLELDKNYLPKIHVLKSELTRKQLIDLYLNDKAFEFFDHIHDTIRKSTVYNNETKYDKNQMVFGLIIIDAFYDKQLDKAVLHHALGNGFIEPRLGVFGSHLLHAWPESWNQVNRFFDERNLDFSQLTNDDSPTKMKALNTGIGAFMHEIGHAYTLDHSGLGIMSRDWSLNKFFFSVYKKESKYYPVKHYTDEDNTGWKNTDAEILSNHEHINNSLGLSSIVGNSKWKASDSEHYFVKLNEKTWHEIIDGILKFKFDFVSDINQVVILYAADRKFYISLDSQNAKFGSTKNDINAVFKTGTWVKN